MCDRDKRATATKGYGGCGAARQRAEARGVAVAHRWSTRGDVVCVG